MNAVSSDQPKLDELRLLEFMVGPPSGGRPYGINVAKVRQVINRPENISELPNPHQSVIGVISERGEDYPVVDLAKWMRLEAGEDIKKRVILAEFNNMKVGFLVTNTIKIHTVSWDMVEPPAKLIKDSDFQYVTGVVRTEEKNLMLLDFERIVSQINPSTGVSSKNIGASGLDRNSATVFIAEDSAFIRKKMTQALTLAGYRVFTAGDGAKALERLRWVAQEAESKGIEIERYLNAIITDVEMPKMDGATLISNIQKIPALADVPVVIFSSMADEANRRKWAPLGAADCVTKPELGELVERIDALIFGVPLQ